MTMRIKPTTVKLTNWINKRCTGILYTSSDEVRVNCPFCTETGKSADDKSHMYINPHKEIAHCFRCDWSGNIYYLVSMVDSCSYWEAIDKLTDDGVLYDTIPDAVASLESFSTIVETPQKIEKKQDFIIEPLSMGGGYNHKLAIQYLKKRNVEDKFIFSRFFGVVKDHLAVYMRITDEYWSARNLITSGNIPKYVNATQSKDDILAIWDSPDVGDYAKTRKGDIHVVEGVFSGLRVLQHEYPVVALLGKTATQGQLKRLASLQRPLKIMLDSDARKESFQLAQKLREMGKCDITIGILETGDPDDNFESHITVAYTLGEIIKERLK